MPKFSPRLIILARRLAADSSKAQKLSQKVDKITHVTPLEPLAGNDRKKLPESASIAELAKQLVKETAQGSGEIPSLTAEELFLGSAADGDSRDVRFRRRVETVNTVLLSKKDMQTVYRWVMEAAYEYAQAIDLPKVTLANFQRNILEQFNAA